MSDIISTWARLLLRFGRFDGGMTLILMIFGAGFSRLNGDVRVDLDVISSNSPIDAKLTVNSVSDSQTGQVSGQISMVLRGGWPPAAAQVRDFKFRAVTNQPFHLSYGFLGALDLNFKGFGFDDFAPGSPRTWEPIDGTGQVTFHSLTNSLDGVVDYSGSGFVICALLASQRLGCTGTEPLYDEPPRVIDILHGSLEFQGDKVRYKADFGYSAPINPSVPSLGSVEGTVHISAVGIASPVLQVGFTNGSCRLTWPVLTSSWVIEQSVGLGSNALWLPILAMPPASGSPWTVLVPATNSLTFFRLRPGG